MNTSSAAAPVLEILKSAAQEQRLGHAIILYGKHLEAIQAAAHALASELLGTSALSHHPDFYHLRPTNKMRQITAEAMRELVQSLQRSGFNAARKVALIDQADRLNPTSSNIFLKTLEEPSAGATLLLVTTELSRLLPTIRSRCMAVCIPGEAPILADSSWQRWLEAYGNWIRSVQAGSVMDATARAQWIIQYHQLIAWFELILETLSAAAFKPLKAAMKDSVESDELEALEVSVMKRLRTDLFKEISIKTRDATLSELKISQFGPRARALSRLNESLERLSGLLQVNLSESTALEAFFLESLTVWTQ